MLSRVEMQTPDDPRIIWWGFEIGDRKNLARWVRVFIILDILITVLYLGVLYIEGGLTAADAGYESGPVFIHIFVGYLIYEELLYGSPGWRRGVAEFVGGIQVILGAFMVFSFLVGFVLGFYGMV